MVTRFDCYNPKVKKGFQQLFWRSKRTKFSRWSSHGAVGNLMLWALRNNWLWVLRSLSTAGSWVATRGWHGCVEWSHIGCRYVSNWSGDFVLKFVSSEEAWHQVSLQQASVWSPQTLHPSSQLRHKVCTHARTHAFWFRRSLRAGSQGRRADWKMTAHDVREGKNSAMWAVASTKWNWGLSAQI
jgi:hypothetical protein